MSVAPPSKSASSRVRSRSAVGHIVERLMIVARDRRAPGAPVAAGASRDGIRVCEAFPAMSGSSVSAAEDAAFLNNAAKFCFPFEEKLEALPFDPRTFTFVLTDGDGSQQFGFCRLVPRAVEASSNGSTSTPSKGQLQPGLSALTPGAMSVAALEGSAAAAIANANLKSNRSQFDLEAICILSYLPWFEVFDDVLDKLIEMRKIPQHHQYIEEFINCIHTVPIPRSGDHFVVTLASIANLPPTAVSNKKPSPLPSPNFVFHSPDDTKMWRIPDHLCLSQLCVYCLSSHALIGVFAALLMERRVLVFSSKLSRVSSAIHALNHLLYPLYWQHVFIPIMTPQLLDYCSAPMPYFIGVHSSMMERISHMPLEEVVVVDLDENRIIHTQESANSGRAGPMGDINLLPFDATHNLHAVLTKAQSTTDDGIPRAFLQYFLSLFGNYQEHIILGQYSGPPLNYVNGVATLTSPSAGVSMVTSKGVKISFDLDGLVANKPRQVADFLNVFLRLQMFQQFIIEQLHKTALNGGEALGATLTNSTLFEREAYKLGNAKYKRYTRPVDSRAAIPTDPNVKLKYAPPTTEKAVRKCRDELAQKQAQYHVRLSQLKQLHQLQQQRDQYITHAMSPQRGHARAASTGSAAISLPPSTLPTASSSSSAAAADGLAKRPSPLGGAAGASVGDKKAPPPRPPPPKAANVGTIRQQSDPTSGNLISLTPPASSIEFDPLAARASTSSAGSMTPMSRDSPDADAADLDPLDKSSHHPSLSRASSTDSSSSVSRNTSDVDLLDEDGNVVQEHEAVFVPQNTRSPSSSFSISESMNAMHLGQTRQRGSVVSRGSGSGSNWGGGADPFTDSFVPFVRNSTTTVQPSPLGASSAAAANPPSSTTVFNMPNRTSVAASSNPPTPIAPIRTKSISAANRAAMANASLNTDLQAFDPLNG
ncbi:hypothetical protein CAOG_08664 [Capsaspora owczarzaki ATCC 30864]|uniref:UDENN domain-containing protein n=1 Tax=Capsaspora owczarzaki (strain ATCC 30864) TaxID=595528 RepID=A0A0D2UAL1_CAPO3|nr:hypothetical protein CAOG_08664 [Capsaspora owczarzaki ATCC 30864]KJE92066.1 hypothetical protein CAOG_008664 [Capsaspora owczarzaki ATCC 30864]|eukprot:XP_011270275.1 hypothetical protein CAOG_08664 [Capsaspora owczarzaki ATCC 30864]